MMKSEKSHMLSTLKKIALRYNPSEVFRSAFASPKATWAYYRRHIKAPTLPSRMMIDPINICNLKCPLCPTGVGTYGARRAKMSYELFEHILSLNPNVRMADLYNLGEPFLNPDIFKMFKLCREKDIRTSTHTNLFYDRSIIDQMLENPPARLHLSVDGATPETYSIYRAGGDFNRIRENMEYLSDRIRKTGKGPAVEWVFLFHKGNKQDIFTAREMARRLNFQFFVRPLVVPPHLAPEWHDPEDLKKVSASFHMNVVCPHLWLKMTIKPTGALAFCCFAYDDADDIGSLADLNTPEELLALWNEGIVRRGRTCFQRKGTFREISKPMLCETCNVYKRSNGLDPKKYPYNTHAHDWMDREFPPPNVKK
ncbi:radical SAM protein [bacterium]|nr:radical SAM protein [bacterium]